METDRVILHCDLNNFYATAACRQNPELKGLPLAVCGNPAHRHGIVLAKSEEAKKYGVKTGEVLWQAQQKCPGLVTVPPDFSQYTRLSKEIQELYRTFTDQVEPFGIDECWLDVTGSSHLFGSGRDIADRLRQLVKDHDLTISVGVSFNKIFAKLGSDLKKPDGTTVITRENYRSLLWPLPVNDMMMVGRSTKTTLDRYGIYTIGQLAQASPVMLEKLFGINGRKLWDYANGRDESPVLSLETMAEAKSVGHGITCTRDLRNEKEALQILHFLAQRVARRLRESGFLAQSLSLIIRRPDLSFRSCQCPLQPAGRSAQLLVDEALALLRKHHHWQTPIRALSLQAGSLIHDDIPLQQCLWGGEDRRQQEEKLEAVTDQLRQRFGAGSIFRASLLLDMAVPEIYQGDFGVMPGSRV